MAFYPDVHTGEAFSPSAALSNDVRHLINGLNGCGGNAVMQNSPGTVRIQVCNGTDTPLFKGTAVSFGGMHVTEDIALAVGFTDPAKPWGVVTQALAPGEIGDCCISGPVCVALAGTGGYAQPSPASPAVFTAGATGAPVLCAFNGRALINIGAGNAENYDGPFAVTYDSSSGWLLVSPGYLSRNGEFVEVAGTELEPQDGLVCVESILGNGEWSVPEIKFGTPSRECYPIAKCRVTGEGDSRSVSVCQFRVPVAIIIVAAECPISAEADDNAGQQ